MYTPIRAVTARLGIVALTLGLMLASLVPPAAAQERVNIRFAPGATSTTINGAVIGRDYVDYILNLRAGQTMVVSLAVTGTNGNGTIYFNILPAGQDYGAIYTGHMESGKRAEVVVPGSGDWAIRVYLMGNDRDTGKTVGYSMDVYVTPLQGNSPPASDSGLVPVFRVPSGDVLNVRDGPGTGNRVVGALANGDRVRVLECLRTGNSTWCRIEMLTDMRERGWVNARYLDR